MNFTPKLKGKFTYSSKEYGNMALTSSVYTENTLRSIKQQKAVKLHRKHTEEYKATKSSQIHRKLKSKNLEIFKYALTA
jgi:hypothetical protein